MRFTLVTGVLLLGASAALADSADLTKLVAHCEKTADAAIVKKERCGCWAQHLPDSMTPEEIAFLVVTQKEDEAEIARAAKGKPPDWGFKTFLKSMTVAEDISSGKIACK